MASNRDAAYRLCYVEGPWAWFTTAPLAEQWGDDWNDAPYEHNAGDPYDFRPYMDERGREPYELLRVAWSGTSLETPADLYPPNSPYSVAQINAGGHAWLSDPGYGARPTTITPVVWANATVEEFVAAIEKFGGSVYFPTLRSSR